MCLLCWSGSGNERAGDGIGMNLSIAFSPLVPLPLLLMLAAAAVVGAILLAIGRPRGAVLRAAALALVVLALANPSLDREEREKLPNVLALVVDQSQSQKIDNRAERTTAVRAAIESDAAKLPNTELRVIEGGAAAGSDGTDLFKSLAAGMADVAPDRVAGAIMITDGVVHDVPANAAELGFSAPVHGLITGRPNERDRRVVLTTAPRFGIVGKRQTVAFRIEQTAAILSGPVDVVARRDGEEIARMRAEPGREARIDVPITHAGQNLVEIEAATVPGELTDVNNRVALAIEGVREKLRVLLVSGEPHSGERTWRNLLKSDANVDLVHFTILRPPEKQDGTPIHELSLIAFPTRELFVTKIDEFDLIIFDRYARQGILPILYFDNIAQYVRKGGAVLVAAGPDYSGPGSLNETPLGSILPAEPVGSVTERPFLPTITDAGHRHPVTRDLPGDGAKPDWSEWFRVVDTRLRAGTELMSGADQPLLVLQREEKGRVALLLSDQIWLWARGYENGGPYLDLVRRLAHWLMKVPELEEEAFRMSVRGSALTIERQTMADTPAPVTLTLPSGATRTLTLDPAQPGLFRTVVQTDEMGLYRATDGTLTALINVGPTNPREFQDVASSTDRLAPIAQETGGSVRRVVNDAGGIDVPRLIAVRSGTRASGSDWIGVRQAETSVARGIEIFPLFSGLIGLALLLGVFALTWARESR